MLNTYLPVELRYENNDEWSLAPAWCDYFAMLGASASCSCNGSRIVAAAALPTRAYIAPFVAIGVVSSAAAAELFDSADKHFQDIVSLPYRASVHFREKTKSGVRRLKGAYLGRDEEGRAKIQVARNGRIHLVTPDRASEVELIKDAKNKRLPERQVGRRLKSNSAFLSQFFSGNDITCSAVNSKVFCAVVGTRKILEEEIKTTHFTVENSDTPSTDLGGTLQDILRVRAFVGENEPFFSEVFPASVSIGSDLSSPRVVILDGANAYLRHQNSWPEANLVVLLDRTDAAFEDAAHALNAAYIECRSRNDEILDTETFPEAPPGVETIFYEERLR